MLRSSMLSSWMRTGLASLVVGMAFAVASCDEPAKPTGGDAPERRFAAVKKQGPSQAERSFCEHTFPASGDGSRAWTTPPSQPLPKPGPAITAPSGAWRWINLWASWCGPCLEELPLLGRWMDALGKEGLKVGLELWSIDDDGTALARALTEHKLPGQVLWHKGGSEVGALLEQLGVARDSAIPIHALVDPSGHLRCVRVGSVGDDAYGAVKTILSGS
jgi:thiol-disulfide isomerase/thioredoxin